MIADTLHDSLVRAQDADADLALLRAALAIPSVTGNETLFARFLEGQLAELGLKTRCDKFAGDRENVWAVAPGDRPNLMILGHTDTVHVRGWEDHWHDDPRHDPFAAVIKDGSVWARGASDLKGGICAAIAGYRMLKKMALNPGSGLTFAFIGDEESGEPGSCHWPTLDTVSLLR